MAPRKQPGRRRREPTKAELAAENARLRRALARQARRAATPGQPPVARADDAQSVTAELEGAREQQAATAEILRLIATSPNDVQPVFDAIARHALRLCGSGTALVVRYSGEYLHLVAHDNVASERVRVVERRFPLRVDRTFPMGAAVLEGTLVHVPDLQTATTEFPGAEPPTGSVLAVPLLQNGQPIGAIGVWRPATGGFPDEAIPLLRTFADQAVIAIENARLFSVFQAKNRDLAEALQQQTATGEILGVIAGSPTDLQPVLDALVESAARLCEAADTFLLLVEGDQLRIAALHGGDEVTVGFANPIHRGWVAGRAVVDARTIHVEDLTGAETEAEFPLGHAIAVRYGHRTALAVPLLREGAPIGVLFLRRREVRRFSDKEIALLRTFADQAVIAIENVRLFRTLEERNSALAEALEQQTGTSEILQVISSSPTNVQPVFTAVGASAARLCDALDAAIFQVDAGVLRLVAHEGPVPLGPVGQFTVPLVRGSLTGRVTLERRTIQIADHHAEEDEYPEGTAIARRYGVRTMLGVPLLRAGEAVGVIALRRAEVRPFTDRQVELLKTFADQAVIAIENVRLFKELEARNAALTESLEQQTATSEILRVISRSPTEIEPVFDAVVASAARLCWANDVAVLLVDSEDLRIAAGVGPLYRSLPPDFRFRLTRGSVAARAVIDQATVHVHDLVAEPEEEFRAGRELAQRFGHRTMLAVPLLREGVPVGVICAFRFEVRPFPEQQIALLRTFADQAVIAIENVRLFRELEARNRDLGEALDRQTATADVLRIIAQSPTELQPVLDAIAASAVRLCAASDAVIERLEGDRFYNAAHAGSQMKGLVPLTRGFPGGRAILDRKRIIIDDIEPIAESEYPDTLELLKLNTVRSGATIPVLSEGRPLGNLAVLRAEVRPFTDAEIALLETFASQAVIAIENVRLFKELESRNKDLGEALERQTATAEILRVISQAQTDVQPVFEAIADSAMRLFGAWGVLVWVCDGELVHLAAARGGAPGSGEAMLERWRTPRDPGGVGLLGRTIRTRAIQHLVDVKTDPSVEPALLRGARERGWRSTVQVPMLRATTSSE
jgi:GAF domain-containing protein